MDKVIVFTIIIIILAGLYSGHCIGIFFRHFFRTGKTHPLPEGIVLFYGQGCPHCADVENFIAQNKIEDKVKISRLEVWYNKSNQLTLAEVVQKCGINANSVGVPFLYDGNGKCYIGEVDIPSFLKIQAGIK